MKKSLIILSACLLFLTCNKKKEESSINAPLEKTGFKYFLNTNEKWSYSYVNYSPRIDWTADYEVLRDTVVIVDGEELKTKVLREHYIQDGPNHDGTTRYYDTIKEIVFYYYESIRTLMRADLIESTRPDLGSFERLQMKNSCKGVILEIDTIQIGEHFYTRFINVLNQEIIEGITLGFSNCHIYPPFKDHIPIGHLVEMKYTSDQFTYHWKEYP